MSLIRRMRMRMRLANRSQAGIFLGTCLILPWFTYVFSCHVPYLSVMDLMFQSECSERLGWV